MTAVLECYSPGPFTAGAPATLIDSQSLDNEVLPAGGLVTAVYGRADSAFSGSANFSVGWNGANGAIVATNAGLTADGLNAADWVGMAPSMSGPTADQTLTVTADSAITGQIHLKIVYVTFNNL